jgi:hypothetical protein
MCVLAPGLSLSIILTLLSMCGTKIKSTCSRPGASPYDPRGRLHANNTKSIVLYNIRLVHILRFHWDFFISCEAANRKQIVNIATRGTM